MNYDSPTRKASIYDNYYFACLIIISIVFTIEYCLRILLCEKKLNYIFSFIGLIDLIAILPVYIIIIFPDLYHAHNLPLKLLRVLIILRLLKSLRYINSARELGEELVESYKKISVFFMIISILILLFSVEIYVIEGPNNGFDSLGSSLYWSIVTITTVGYGDITPHTMLGRIIASLLILIGYTIIAIPTGVLTANMINILQRKKIVVRENALLVPEKYKMKNRIFVAIVGKNYSYLIL